MTRRPERLAAATTAPLLALVYSLTLAPSVTFWDAGEFIAAVETFGIPHPPGTPLFVLAARAWALLLPFAGTALASNLFSAACAAGAGAVLAWLVARWTGSAVAGVAAAIAAGSGSSVWLNATETEVYSASLALSALMLLCGERRRASGDARWTVLLAFLLALAVPLHLSALVAAPAAVLLAVSGLPRDDARREGALLAAATLAAVGAGRASGAMLGAGAACLALALAFWRVPPARRVAVPVALLLGLSPLLVMLVRATHDPGVNQGDPSTVEALVHVVGRRQYAVASLLPRQAPLWLQLGNLFEWADWQWALGLAPGVEPSPLRTPVTLLFGALALAGAREHRRRHPASWAPWALLLASATVGVVLYLNLKAGPSFGWGVIPDAAPREARERDYFFALGFWAWGAWAGLGAVAAAERLLQGPRSALAGLAVAALPVALNWTAVSRAAPADAVLPRAFARALLEGAPAGAVLLAAGDNDTYPLWYLQQVEGVRRDVTVVTLPLLGAPWYRAELVRRHRLLPDSLARAWPGIGATAAAVAERAAALGRPLAATVALEATERALVGAPWTLRGHVYLLDRGRSGPRVDTAAVGAAAGRIPATLAAHAERLARSGGEGPSGLRRSPDRTSESMLAVLACPLAALRADSVPGAARLLDSRCNYR